jgi:hypothetical protein|tara:strand:- start:1374 stop:2138 length:765 start_codon:yes stop_codon:yes gene_type:complete
MKKTDKKIQNLVEGDNFIHDGDIYFVLENQSISTSFNEVKVLGEDGNHSLRLRKECVVNITEKKTPKLNKPFRTSGGPKKFSVHVRNAKGNIVKVNFGDPNMEIKRDDPERRKNFRARHNCADKTDKTKAGYWSCKMWEKGKSVSSHLKDDFDVSLKQMIAEKKLTKDQTKKRDDLASELLGDKDFNKRYGKKDNIRPRAKNKSDVAYAIATLIATGRGNQIKRGRKKKKKVDESFNRLNTVRNSIRRDLNEEI